MKPAGFETTDVERLFWAYDRASPSNIVVMVKLEGFAFSRRDAVVLALNEVVKRHPYLCHAFSTDGLRLVPFHEPVEAVDSALDWKTSVEDEMHRPFDLSRPSLRAVFFDEAPGFRLVVSLPHAVSDAVGAYHWLHEALRHLDVLLSGAEPEVPVHRFLRPSTRHFPSAAAPTPWCRPVGPSSRLISDLGRAAVGAGFACRSEVRVITLDEAATALIVARARRLGVSVNSLLTAQALVSLESLQRLGEVRIQTAVDLRSLLPERAVGPRDLGMWAGRFSLTAQGVLSAPVDAWAAAFHEGVALFRPTAFEGLTRNTPPASATLKMTNHGNLDRAGLSMPLKNFRVSEFRGFTPLHRGLQAKSGAGVIPSVFHKKLDLSFLFPAPGTPGSWGEALVDHFVSELTGARIRQQP